MNAYTFRNGMTIAELKEVVNAWPEILDNGEPAEVWIGCGNGLSNIVKEVWPLNNRNGKADMLLEPEMLDKW